MDKDTLVKVSNRDSGKVGYTIPEMNVRRQFAPNETKEVRFAELEALSYLPGGEIMLAEYLVVQDEEAIKQLLHKVEPEYFYTREDIINLMKNGSLDEFLDCLDFAPAGALDMVKDLAVSLPLNDMEKREAILEKMNFNVTKAIEVQNTKYDGDTEDSKSEEEKGGSRRRAVPQTKKEEGRRADTPKVPKYKAVD